MEIATTLDKFVATCNLHVVEFGIGPQLESCARGGIREFDVFQAASVVKESHTQ